MNASPTPDPAPDDRKEQDQREFAEQTFRVVPHAGKKYITMHEKAIQDRDKHPGRWWWRLFHDTCRNCGAKYSVDHTLDGCGGTRG